MAHGKEKWLLTALNRRRALAALLLMLEL